MQHTKVLFQNMNRDTHITIDMVGDSITHGLNHCRPEEIYVAKFAAALAARYPLCTVRRFDGNVTDEGHPLSGFDGPILVSLGQGGGTIDVIRNGVGGKTVLRALARIEDFTGTLANGRRPDLTMIMLGFNDSLENDPAKYVTPEAYREHYRTLLHEIRRRNPETDLMIVGSTYNGDSIAPYCARAAELAVEEGIPYVDMFAFWMAHYDPTAPHFGQGDWLSDVSGDACHPSPPGAELTARHLFEAFTRLIGCETDSFPAPIGENLQNC